jgi:hypothetical protein
MRFLLRLGFWLGVILVLLPSVGSQPAPETSVGPGEAMSAAKAAVADMREFCARQADACVIGSQAAAAIGRRAQIGAKMLYEFISEQVGPSETGSTVKAEPSTLPSQNTLSTRDLEPPWQGPQPRPHAHRG